MYVEPLLECIDNDCPNILKQAGCCVSSVISGVSPVITYLPIRFCESLSAAVGSSKVLLHRIGGDVDRVPGVAKGGAYPRSKTRVHLPSYRGQSPPRKHLPPGTLLPAISCAPSRTWVAGSKQSLIVIGAGSGKYRAWEICFTVTVPISMPASRASLSVIPVLANSRFKQRSMVVPAHCQTAPVYPGWRQPPGVPVYWRWFPGQVYGAL